MRRIIYCKYNMNRRPEFQTRTTIVQDDQGRHIEKTAITETGRAHIERFDGNYSKSRKIYPSLNWIVPKLDGATVEYPYLIGMPIEQILFEGDTAQDIVNGTKKGIEEYLRPSEEVITEFAKTEEFEKLFGDVDCSDEVCIAPCNIDMIFDNIMIVDGEAVVYDYEWVFDFPVPRDYVIYRVLCRVYAKKIDILVGTYSLEAFVSLFGIDEEKQLKYRNMEDSFLGYVFEGGDTAFNVSDGYLKKRNRLDDYDFYRDGYNNTLNILHDTEDNFRSEIEKHKATIEEYNRTVELLHKTENELTENIKKYTDTAELYREASSELEKHIELLKETQADLSNEIESNKRHLEMIRQKDEYIAGLQGQLALVTGSVSWKVTKPIRGVKKLLTGQMFNQEAAEEKQDGYEDKGVEDRAPESFSSVSEYLDYQSEELDKANQDKVETSHKISLITPLFNTPRKYLVDLLESVVNQSSDAWELCVIDYSNDQHDYVGEICSDYASRFPGINYKKAAENKGISDNSNECASLATGDYIGVLDHDDVLQKHAIQEMIKIIEAEDADFIYSDEAKFEEEISDANYVNIKPDFTMDELCAHNFICHFNVFRKTLFDKVGGYRKEFDGSQDHDLVLRLTEQAEHIVHVPRVLYFWRVHELSVAKNIEAKPYATRAGEKAVTEHFTRIGLALRAESIINNIPVYRIFTEEEKKLDCTIAIWGTDEAGFEKAKDRIQNSDGVEIVNAGEYRDLAELIASVKTRYLLFVRAGISFDYKEYSEEYSKYIDRHDIAAWDSKIFSPDMTILSGGAYLTEDKLDNVRIRCMGGGEAYTGYENAMLYSRTIPCSLGLCTMIDLDIWRAENAGPYEGSVLKAVLRYTNDMRLKGYVNILVPFCKVVSKAEDIKKELIEEIRNMGLDTGNVMFLNPDILKMHLE